MTNLFTQSLAICAAAVLAFASIGVIIKLPSVQAPVGTTSSELV